MLRLRLAVGFVLALLIVTVTVGVVATSAAIAIELSDGDTCETGGRSDVGIFATPKNATTFAGNVTKCIAGSDAPDTVPDSSPRRNG